LNIINQSVIGAKEGVVEAISKLVGSDITDAILRTADGSDHKSIDDFTLYEVMKVAIDGANRLSTNDVLEQLIEVINHQFDFRKKVSVNMELMQSNAARMATYGIIIGIPQLTLALLANIKTATKADYGREILIGHACHPQEVRIQSRTRCDVAPNHLNGACGSGRGEGPKRCTRTKRWNSAFSCHFSIIPQLNDAEQRHRYGIHRISIRC
jgi:hypothetical protein